MWPPRFRSAVKSVCVLWAIHVLTGAAHGAQYDPIVSPVRTEERELFIRCASGAVQTKMPRARVLVTPAKNYTNVPTLQIVLDEAFVKTAGDLSLEAYPASDGFNSPVADPKLYDYVMRGEVSVVDRAVTTEELKREFGVDFGGGRGSSFLGVPSSERWTVGWVSTTVNVFKTELRVTSAGETVAAMKLASSASARGAFFTLGNNDGLNASVVVTYGRQTTVERQAGMQRATITALRAFNGYALPVSFRGDIKVTRLSKTTSAHCQ